MNYAVMPVRAATGLLRRRRAFAMKLGECLRRGPSFSDEDDVVRRHEGRSWCDSAERSINYDIMASRHLRF
jgi:hypothetical protein